MARSGDSRLPAREKGVDRQSDATGQGIDQEGPIATLDDARLVALARDGRTEGFDELLIRYRDKATRLVVSTLGPRNDTEDIVQDVFLKLYRSLDRFRGDASFSTWLYTATINRCRDEMRRKKVRRFFSFEEWFANSSEVDSRLVTENGERTEAEERIEAVRRGMSRLPADTRMLLHLREVEGASYRELAGVFDVEIGTIKSRLARARRRLREELLPYMTDGRMPGEGR